MLLGYNKDTNNIEFLFTDTDYLNKKFSNNSAKISNFWKMSNHNLIEFFVDAKDFSDYNNYRMYKIINNKIVKKTDEEILADKNKERNKVIRSKISNKDASALCFSNKSDYIKSLEARIKILEDKLNK